MTQSQEFASRAAAFGGVTTLIDFAGDDLDIPDADVSDEPIMKQVELRTSVFSDSYIDFSFHFNLVGEVSPSMIGEIGEAIQSGVPSFKVFTTFGVARCPTGHLWAIFEQVKKYGGIIAVHAEEDDIVTYMTEKLVREGNDQGYNMHLVHNNISEDIAFRKITRLAKHTETAIYFVHTTAKEGVAAIAEARNESMPVAYTKFVSTGRISLERFAAITSTNAAKIMGLYPQKGAIAAGSDADIVLFDPDLQKKLTLQDLHADSDYSIWEGFECRGYPVMTILRGKVIVEDGLLVGSTSDGRWLKRRIAPDVLARPVV